MSGWEPVVVPAARGTPFIRERRTSCVREIETRHEAKNPREEVEAQGRIERQRSLLIDVRFSSLLVESWKSSRFGSQHIVSLSTSSGRSYIAMCSRQHISRTARNKRVNGKQEAAAE